MRRVDDNGIPYCQFCIAKDKVQIKADVIVRHKTTGDFITFCNKHYGTGQYKNGERKFSSPEWEIRTIDECIVSKLSIYLQELIRLGYDKNKLMELWDIAMVKSVQNE